MTAPPPRAPTFPSLDDRPIRVIDDIDDDVTSSSVNSTVSRAPATAPVASVPSTDTSFYTPVRPRPPSVMSNAATPGVPSGASSASSTYATPGHAPPSGPGSNGPSTGGRVYRSRLGAILTWKDPKVSAVAFAIDLLFFYLTMWKQYSILSVIGASLGIYLCIGLLVVNVNKASGNSLDRFIKRPPTFAPLFRKESAYRLADTLVEEGNQFAEDARHVLYCDDTSLTVTWIVVAFFTYIIGRSFSLLPVMFLFTLGLFTIPIAYEKNKKQVDEILVRFHAQASKHVETGRKVAGERASNLYDLAAEKSAPLLAKSPALKSVADKVGFTPAKSKRTM